MTPTNLCDLNATELVRRIHCREISAVEVLQAHLERIEQRNPALNALVTLVPEQALKCACLLYTSRCV